ncbi:MULTISPECIES: CDP-diacylglycerol--glycerol-3-phosphate 3-phosphatidyltransferase [Alteribacter]|uniref:CDP-diacylglycerol--glycerol-3-phosphate 3-phosphatidyltransferase n=1 Tax=Alteribacter keqinensis TaxID=2483800 RepID=A0A3M7TVP3_9BACI|nr:MULTISPECIES: CDP-diacylglycerol--glycerol-3-phosphate 3-phosphatidyltransferase [Alteribacter]MBM7094243.1 CDP-diacylglycerol--glycerol-3-phosphate 3-phosphatidyltransferase [Alteribacter salitolerans]RNA69523.1 CDP-diacylglycerol--glycerol-3-phosphate 3-phosphatidyltransferase [Alteribacter keqinensis]
MNVPNQITISRIFLIPLFMIFLLIPFDWGVWYILGAEIPVSHFVAALIFIIAASTDWLDGYYARKFNLVTNMGKFLDPLADKLLITAAFVSLVELGMFPAWAAILILSREFAVTGLRLVAAADGDVIAASNWGKWKTVSQIVAASAIMLHNMIFEALNIPFDTIMIYIAVILTVFSGWDYFVKNKHVLSKST